MKHARQDYNRFQDPENKIPQDEPVFLLRARDKYAAQTVIAYAEAISGDVLAPTASHDIAERAREWAKVMADYGMQHGTKPPDMPPGC